MGSIVQRFVYLVEEGALAAADASCEGDGGLRVGLMGGRLYGREVVEDVEVD